MSLLLLFNEAVAFVPRTDVDLRAPAEVVVLTPMSTTREITYDDDDEDT